ncbi:MAG: ATP-binding cassette domain-containing protein, partial [Firmicutes bacterium]|nr:ATP-binding cassette domain-containing protein [Bacillota bacterium]
MAEPLLQVENLYTQFRRADDTVYAVNGVSFSVDPGEVVGIVGESGSGKSVSMMSLLGLVRGNA